MAVVSAVVGLVVAGPALGGDPAPYQVYVGKKADSPASSGITVNVKKGKKKVVYFWVQNETSEKINVTLDDGFTTKASGYRIRWFKNASGKNEITESVEGPGKPVNVPADGKTYFRATVKNKSATDGFCLNGRASTRDFDDGATAGVNNGLTCFQ